MSDGCTLGALDAGAHGLLVPLVYSPEDAKKTVDFCKFPPRGQRGFGSPFPMQTFSNNPTSTEYLQQANDSLVTIVQIETKEALESVSLLGGCPGSEPCGFRSRKDGVF
jgi:4-hydroxy-2-oxoheptanedioate aldolase